MKNILLVEDNQLLAENIIALLEEETYTVFHAATAKQAVYLAKKNSVDIILCDIMLPDGDGYQILDNLKNDAEYVIPPFVFLTAKSQRTDSRKGMELGADDYLTKPFTQSELLSTIQAQIEKRNYLVNKNNSEKSKKNILKAPGNEHEQNKQLNYDGFIFINEKDNPGFYAIKKITYIKSMQDYTQLFLNNSQKLVVRKTLTHWESVLPAEFFIRIHRQTIINLQYVAKVERDKSYTYNVYLKNLEVPFKLSQRYSRKIKQMQNIASFQNK